MPGFEETMLSYSLKSKEQGWAWYVVDEDGETVASGVAVDRDVADAAVRHAYQAAAARPPVDLQLAA